VTADLGGAAAREVHQQFTGDGNVFTGTGDVYVVRNEAVPLPDRAALRDLREKVRQFWVRGVLESSLHGKAMLALGKETMPDAVDHPWGRTLELPDGTKRSIDPKTPALRLYEDASRMLLVLGEPGSGKTTTLLELARDLIEQAERDESRPVPVVLNLATWGQAEREMGEWIAGELAGKYGAPRKLAKGWLERGGLVLLLDGLDEVAEERRAACVGAINEYLEKVGVPGMCMCTRLREYGELGTKVRLSGAVRVEPLTDVQVAEYVEAAGEKLVGFCEALHAEAALREMARSPLMLSIMSLAYEDAPVREVAMNALETAQARRAHAFRTYVRKMFERRGKAARSYGTQETVRWLHHLAKGMRERSQTVFLVEDLQPDLLSYRSLRTTYAIMSRASLGLLLVIPLYYPFKSYALLAGGSTGICIGIIDAARFISPRMLDVWTRSVPGRIAHVALYALLGCVSTAILSPMLPILKYDSGAYAAGGLALGIVFGLRNQPSGPSSDIRAVEALRWSWKGAARGSRYGFLGCAGIPALLIVLFTLLVLLTSSNTDRHIDGESVTMFLGSLASAIFLGIAGAIFGAIIGGVERYAVEAKSRVNQGILLSLRTGTIVFVVSEFVISLFFLGLHLTVTIGPSVLGALTVSLRDALYIAPAVALLYGGFDVIQHYILRLMLAVRGLLPLRLARFLDHCASLIFLQKVGGGYVFVHRLLLEHFAESPDDRGA
jgi:eukaryotic-like serine/threonine-protein kinase